MKINVESIPRELRERKQWVTWKRETRPGEAKPTKIPYQVSGDKASSTDPSTWASFTAALAAFDNRKNGFHGIGYVFSESDPFTGIDLDDSVNGTIEPWALTLVKKLSSYTETSPSGEGLHVIVKGSKPGDRCVKSKPHKIEIYSQERFFTISGSRLEEFPGTIEHRQAELEEVYRQVFDEPKPHIVVEDETADTKAEEKIDLDDEQLLDKARKARDGEKFRKLFDAGDTSEYGGDDSAADFALLALLAFWTQRDARRMDTLFRRSALMRPKWDTKRRESTYGKDSIANAIAKCKDVYTPGVTGGDGGDQDDLETARKVVAAALVAAKDDVGSAFAPAVLSALLLLQEKDRAEFERSMAAFKKAKVSIRALREEIGKLFIAGAPAGKPAQGSAVLFEEVEPWPDPVDGAELLDEMKDLLSTYSILPAHGAAAMALWTMGTWAFDAFEVFARLLLTSPLPRCGKTRTLALLLARAVSKPLSASNVTAAALFRSIEKWRPTLLIDEADSFLKENEELRGIVNSGHSRGTAQVIRCVGDNSEPAAFSTWAPLAIAMIGVPAGTILDRSIAIEMKRRRRGETTKRIRRREVEPVFLEWRRRAARWAADNIEALRGAEPEAPDGLDDRAGDNWGSLLAIADLAGGDWPEIARAAAAELSGDREKDADSLGILLLADIRSVFHAATDGTAMPEPLDRLSTEDILTALNAMEERPWPAFRKEKGLSSRNLSGILKPFKILPRKIRIGEATARGYLAESLADAWERYLPPLQSGTTEQAYGNRHSCDSQSGTRDDAVPDPELEKPYENRGCSAVPDENPIPGEES